MSWGFEKGRTYNRRRDIHGRFGGQQQGGIVTPANHGLVIAITGEEGLRNGYSDGLRADGVWEYFGEGQLGDMAWVRGNRAIGAHSIEGRSLLLFRKTNGGLNFEGEMVYEGHHVRRAPDREGNMRDAIVFELRPLDAIVEHVEADDTVPSVGLADLRARAYSASEMVAIPSQSVTRTAYIRARDVKLYVLARAAGTCEGCHCPAPFIRRNGTPYLEPHHILRVSDGGPDHPAHVAALCPTCHRRVHHSADGQAYNRQLASRIATIEKQWSDDR